MRSLLGAPQVITQAALAEFRQGNRERGRSLFEGVLRNYPRRLDLWSVYLDQVTRRCAYSVQGCQASHCLTQGLAACGEGVEGRMCLHPTAVPWAALGVAPCWCLFLPSLLGPTPFHT